MDSTTYLVWFGRMGILEDPIVVDVQNAHMMCTSCYVASSYNTNDGKSGCMSIIEVLEDG